METILDQKNAADFCCKLCDFICSKKSNFDKHLLTRKHLRKQNCDHMETFKNAENKYDCLCGKKYKTRTGLWKHKKCCVFIEKEEQKEIISDEQNFVKLLMDENKSLKSFMIEQNMEFKSMILDVCKQIHPNSSIVNSVQNNNNSHNKTFNLQVFLNETCKDAMNIMDFVDSLQIQLSDLENVGRNGFVAGISDIILKNLKALDITQRPIHCSDQKREIVYVKDDNVWHNDTKEQPENQKLKKAIKYIAHKNTCLIKEWKAKYPDCGQSASRKSDLYNKIVYESMSLDNANAEKIIKRIAKEMGIDSTFKKKL
jgi:hypothetical protein